MIFCACLLFGCGRRLVRMSNRNVNVPVHVQNDPLASLNLTREKWEEIVRECRSNGRDAHQATAAILFNVPYEKVTPRRREFAKRYTFAFRFAAEYGAPTLDARMKNIKRDGTRSRKHCKKCGLLWFGGAKDPCPDCKPARKKPTCADCAHFLPRRAHQCAFTLPDPDAPVKGTDDASTFPCFLEKDAGKKT